MFRSEEGNIRVGNVTREEPEVGSSWHNLEKRKKALWLEHNEQEYA